MNTPGYPTNMARFSATVDSTAGFALSLLLLITMVIASQALASAPLQTSLGKIPLPPPGVPVMAGFGNWTNNTNQDVVVISAKSSSFEKVEIHQTTVKDDVARMRKMKQLVVPANASVELKHGGLHLMLKKPLVDLAVGQHVVIELNFESGDSVSAHFEIAEGMHMQHKKGHDMKKMKHRDKDEHHNGHSVKN